MKMEPLNIQLPAFFNWIVQSSLQACILICVIVVIRGLLCGRLSARSQYLLWMLLLVRLVMPWAPFSPVSIFNLVPKKTPPKQMNVHSIDAHIDGLPALEPFVAGEPMEVGIALKPATNNISEEMSGRIPRAETTGTLEIAEKRLHKHGQTRIIPFDMVRLLPLLWLIVAVVLAGFGILAYTRFWVVVRREVRVTDQEVLDLLRTCKANMGIRAPLPMIETDKVDTPTLFGAIRPVLLLPDGLVQTLGYENLRCILLHELAHLKRHDILLGWLMNILQVLHWFNPIIWLGFWYMRRDRELACDALAMQHMQEADTYVYGRTIVHLLERFVQRRYLPSMVGILENRGQIQRRISRIAEFKRSSQKISAFAVALILVLACVILTNA
jgi:bla regulator protein BlaR1